MHTSRTLKWCFCGLFLVLLLTGLLEVVIAIENGDSRLLLSSCVFLLMVMLGCVAAAFINVGALKLLARLAKGRKAGSRQVRGE